MQQCLNTGENHIIITYITKRHLHLATLNRHTNAAVCNTGDHSRADLGNDLTGASVPNSSDGNLRWAHFIECKLHLSKKENVKIYAYN